MKNLFYLLVMFGTLQISIAQNQFKKLANQPFEGLNDGAIALSDVNANGMQDVLIIGQNNDFEEVTKLYLNTGNGNYKEAINTPFVGVELGAVAFADLNNDSLPDLLLTGLTSASEAVTKLYINIGNGEFLEDNQNTFEGAYYSSIAFADVDSNGSQDILISGLNSSLRPFSKLYINDGKANFKEKHTSIEAVSSGSISTADVNGNEHLDVLFTGRDSNGKATTQLYINDGKGNFSAVKTPFEGLAYSDAAFADIDGSGTMDLILTGNADKYITKWYKNDGQANFEEVTNSAFEAVGFSSLLIADINKDGHPDVMISGENSVETMAAKLYINDGVGNFTISKMSLFQNVDANSKSMSPSIQFHNFIMFGQNTQGAAVSYVYIK